MKVTKSLGACLIPLLFSISNLKAQEKKQAVGFDALKIAYHQAKHEFSTFEKEHGHFIETPNIRMHYLTWGNPSDPAFIWVHGSLTNGYELLNIADSLASAGYFVIAIDYYGHGQTGIPRHEVSLYHLADDIRLLMDTLNIKKAFLGGFSRGAYACTAFYDAYPERVHGLVLEDGGTVASNTYYHKLSEEELKTRARAFDKKTQNPWDTTYTSELAAFHSIYDPNEKGSQFNLLSLIRENDRGLFEIYSGTLGQFHMGSSREFLDLVLRPTKVGLFAQSMAVMEPKIIFRNLNCPVLILDPVAAKDPMPFRAENAELQKQHPDLIKHNIYLDTEHNIHYEHPQRFIRDVIGFLKRNYVSEK